MEGVSGRGGEAEAAKWTLPRPGQPTAHQASAPSSSSARRGPGLLNHIHFNGHISLETAYMCRSSLNRCCFRRAGSHPIHDFLVCL